MACSIDTDLVPSISTHITNSTLYRFKKGYIKLKSTLEKDQTEVSAVAMITEICTF